MTLAVSRLRPTLSACAVALLTAAPLATVAAALPVAAQAQISPYAQALAESVAGSAGLAQFYQQRNYQPIWTSAQDEARRAAFFAALDRAVEHGLPAARYDAAGLRAGYEAVASERQRGRLEARMSDAFLTYAHDVQSGVIDPKTADPGLVREVRRSTDLALLEGVSGADPRAFIRGLPPTSIQYVQLQRARHDLEAAIEAGGWGARVTAKALRPGDTGDAVVALRDRLMAMGYLGRSAAASYDGAIQKAVQRFQDDHGLTPDGVAGAGTIDELNVEPEARMRSVVVAMERLRWMNGLPLGDRHIWVNLPDFSAKIVDHGKVTFETVTVVGMNQLDRRSPEFSDQMEFMVINPTWNVPRSITVKEYLPMLQKDPNAAGHLRIVDRRGRPVDRAATDFTQFTASNFPFSMSQPPSDGNALGLVKFMFPNQWNIYLHDTPSKSLFKKEVRAYSHGCIRLGDPFDFAYALLAPQSADPKAEFASHLATRSENTIMLKTPVPVHLVYFTAWPTVKGGMTYRRDVYGRDARIFDALEKAGVALRGVEG